MHHFHGWTAEELLRQHPDLRPEQAYSALAYSYDHFNAMVAELEASLAAAEGQRASQALSRNKLLKRWSAGRRDMARSDLRALDERGNWGARSALGTAAPLWRTDRDRWSCCLSAAQLG
jgi:hypothetical protein